MNLLENLTTQEITNEASREFAKALPRTYALTVRYDNQHRYDCHDIEATFEDGFLAGLLWFKPILCDDYIGEKSELQIRARNDMISKSENMVPENINQLTFGWK